MSKIVAPRDRLLPLPEVQLILGLKTSTIYKKVANGELPAPLKIGGSVRWSQNELHEWIEQLKGERDNAA